jgi:hypothetical protein
MRLIAIYNQNCCQAGREVMPNVLEHSDYQDDWTYYEVSHDEIRRLNALALALPFGSRRQWLRRLADSIREALRHS